MENLYLGESCYHTGKKLMQQYPEDLILPFDSMQFFFSYITTCFGKLHSIVATVSFGNRQTQCFLFNR